MNGSVPLDARAVGASDCWVAAGAAALDWVEAMAVPVLVAPLEAGALLAGALAAGAELLDELLGAGVDGLLAAGVVWLASGRDLLQGLSRLGFDEISVRKGQRYLTVVVDHHTGRLVWAHAGRDRKTVEKFLDLLGAERCEQVKLVSCDDADWITRPVAERCPGAVICLDPFHIVKAATDALDEVRREVWNEARRAGNKQLAAELKGARFALWKNARNLTDRQKLKLASIQQTNKRLYRAYLLSQQLRQVYRTSAQDALVLLEAWLQWARRCRLEPFRKLARRITEQRDRVEAALANNLSNARVEQINTQIRLIMRRGFGYHSENAVIALAMLSLGGLCPPLPDR